MSDSPLHQLSAAGQSVWLDFLSRPFVAGRRPGGAGREGTRGVTSNPTIFQTAIA